MSDKIKIYKLYVPGSVAALSASSARATSVITNMMQTNDSNRKPSAELFIFVHMTKIITPDIDFSQSSVLC